MNANPITFGIGQDGEHLPAADAAQEASWERAVERYTKKTAKQLDASVAEHREKLKAYAQKTLAEIITIGKLLEAIRRQNDDSAAVYARWERLGYSQPLATQYIQVSRNGEALTRYADVKGISLGVKAAYGLVRKNAEALADWRSLEDDELVKTLEAEKVLRDAKKNGLIKQARRISGRSVESLQKHADTVIALAETFEDEAQARKVVAELALWCKRYLKQKSG